MSNSTIRLSACLFSHSRCIVYFLTLRLTAYVFCTIRLTAVYSLTVKLAACLVLHYAHILSLSGILHVYSHSQACCHLFSHSHSGSLPVYSHTIRLAACLFSLSLRLAACLFSHYRARCLSILTLTQARCLSILTLSGSLPVYSLTQACCLSILTPADSLPTYSLTIRLTAIYSHSIRLAAYLFSHYQANSLSILTLKLLSICFHTQCC